MSVPIIGVCAASEKARWGFWNIQAAIVSSTYVAKIRAAGGMAMGLIPDPRVTDEPDLILDRVDALMLIGGVDLEPATYGKVKTDRTEATAPDRDEFELALTRGALRRDMPILGICRGMQVLNVATGGTLHEHLRDVGYVEHRPAPGRIDSATFHEVVVEPDTWAASMIGSGVQTVNSHHHQGVDVLGDGAVITARALPDGLPEALEWPHYRYALGVQWHPESVDLQHALNDFASAAAESKKGRVA